MTPNLERRTSRSASAQAVRRSRFGLNSKRAHPPIPPRGCAASSAATRELEARALQVRRLRFDIQTLIVAAVVQDGAAQLVDRQGRLIGGRVQVDRLGPMDAAAIEAWSWRLAARAMAGKLAARTANRLMEPWQQRAESLVASFRLRGLDLARRGGWCHFARYSTTTWEAAAKRLVQQIHNKMRVRSRSGWERWAYTVSNNQKKRADRYAQG